jgi:hypothetical protein
MIIYLVAKDINSRNKHCNTKLKIKLKKVIEFYIMNSTAIERVYLVDPTYLYSINESLLDKLNSAM